MANDDDLDLDVEGAEEAAPKSKLLIIVLAVVVLLGISAAATLMLTGVLSGDKPESVAEVSDGKSGKPGKSENGESAQKAPLNYVPLDPPFVVNFSANSDIRFLQITIEAGTRDPAVVDQIREHRPAIRNSLVMLFSSQDPQALNEREGKEQLRADTLAEVRKVLKSETGDAGVESVFFTSFVMQ